MTIIREEALTLLNEWVQSESLKKHMLAVETVMRAYARKYGEDEDLWSICGLLHDFDYEKHPTEQEHPFVGTKLLKEKGYPQEIIDAILGHALYSGVARESNMAKVLFAVDELTGFVVACAWIRPDKIKGLTAQSVNKKLKIKTFAEKVSREDITLGVEELGVDKDEHINFVIKALQDNADALGLNP